MPFPLLYSKKHRCDQYEDIFDLLFLIKDFPVFASSGENKTVEEPFSLCHTTQNGSRSKIFHKKYLGLFRVPTTDLSCSRILVLQK